ncbi:MAG TPA: hypothetical protein VH437_09780 [Terriglobales bacterium]|jgi:hypothetical protein
MFAIRLINLIESRADKLSEGLLSKLEKAPQCRELMKRVPKEEVRRRTFEIYHNLTDWLLSKTEAEIEERYIGLGMRRARQAVPFSAFLWAVGCTKEHLWEFLEAEGMLEQPLELFGELGLAHSMARFFDHLLYSASIGYEAIRQEEAQRLQEHYAAVS